MKYIILLLIITLFVNNSSSQEQVRAYYYNSLFLDINKNHYIETYIAFVGNSLTYIKTDEGFQAEVEVTMLFTQDSKVKTFNKYNLKSPFISSKENAANFIDQQRLSIEPGVYNFELKIKDINNPDSKELVFFDILQSSYLDNEIAFSGIQYIEKYSETITENILSKNGLDLYPYISDFFPSSINRFIVYNEIYFTDKVIGVNDSFLLKYGIERIDNLQYINEFTRVKKQNTAIIIPILADFNIESLPSGNYNFRIDVIDKNNKLLTSKRSFFQRSNPKEEIDISDNEKLATISIENTFVANITNSDTLTDFLKCLIPIANDREQPIILAIANEGELTMKQITFYAFWKTRNSLNPEKEWLSYKEKVVYVNQLYKTTIRRGYESDRGRVYLQYGEPNQIIKSSHEPTAYPYEIWHYYTLGNQRNKRFVFYNPMIVGNDYTILHSDVKGEIYDSQWERRLSKRTNTLYNHDAKESDDQWGGRARENFKK